MDEEVQTPEEMIASLGEYREQREQVQQLLAVDPGNEEYLEMARGLDEVIELTQDLLNAAGTQPQAPAVAEAASPAAAVQESASAVPAGYSVGMKVSAMFSGDKQWYKGTVTALAATHATILFDDYGNSEEVEYANVKIIVTDEEKYVGVSAPKRVKVEEGVLPKEIPKSLTINEDDDDDTKEKKRKKIKQFKQRLRQQEQHMEHNSKQSSWQAFQKGKGMKRKAGFMTSGKKESIFKSSDSGKVGVVGSGRGMTDFATRARADRG
mmetsp:Transcript_20334/g.24369  ORF Transcript_20334/g.24369 Transcript_20334/m.24369 type:complete len:266 (-) Transcript_20334:344-1141(-)|eukprot:CAMPEP_0197848004 /NCGR_PEP_ID=MMETSP1438-20131217/7738_1 /TAXON_ID=1461541 /ORGANISM="Pterosperma sp., Strain CCMP1384" /LENGTH=265 /DNA_ID=CAMNT_0043460107 /DNA_START=127 /DNA_END=924 /DNA_ORIENTATION=+